MSPLEDFLDQPLRNVLPQIQLGIMRSTTYFGVQTLKSPLDWWVYMEIIHEVKPDIIIELGTHYGGSALALAHVLDNLNHGRVISVGLSHSPVPAIVREHKRITLVTGAALQVIGAVRAHMKEGDKVLVIEDSDHSMSHTLEVLQKYGKLVTVGSYIIVEDGIAGHGLNEPGGPYEAVEAFLKQTDKFKLDRNREHFLITWNPKGYLRRVK